jgi:hypothetical protein
LTEERTRKRLERERLKPALFDNEHIEEASAARASPVAKTSPPWPTTSPTRT